jgi:hypothetical protein
MPKETKNSSDIQVGDVVQLAPGDHAFSYCFVTVTEVKTWGIQGFVAIPTGRGEMPGQAYTRVKWADMTKVGKADWIIKDSDDMD